jgi:SsrA-binding protein
MEQKRKINIKNRKASFEYEFLDNIFESGVILHGSEIKSIRQNGASINEAYCYVNNNEIFIKNMYISELKNAAKQHEPSRERKLLLTKKEINKIIIELKNKGITLIPICLYNKKGLVKINITLAKGKKNYDKRSSIRETDKKRDSDRELNSL